MLPKFNLADIRSRMFNRPLLVTQDKALDALGVMGPKLDIERLLMAAGPALSIEQLKAHAAATKAASDDLPGDGDLKKYRYDYATDTFAERDPYELWQNVAVLPIRGTLMAENGIDPFSGATGYDGLSYKIRRAGDDSRVKGAILDIDSGGGEVVDLFELCAQLRAFGEKKPLRAIVRGNCCSAAYAIAACAGPGNITSAPYSVVGSLGAIMMHADFSKHLENEGIDVTLITSAAHKADGSHLQPLDAEVAERLQAMVDSCAAAFLDHVASARGPDRDALAAQEARFYSGPEALSLGLVDQFMSWDESMRDFAQSVNSAGARPGTSASSMKGMRMSSETPAPAAEVQPETKAMIDAARTEGHAAGVTAGATNERERILAIVDIDAKSSLSDAARGSIESGTSAGDHAIALAKANKAAGPSALANARADAADPASLPAASAETAAGQPGQKPVNRGQAYAERKAAKAD